MTSSQDRLKQLFQERAVILGERKLASGRMSPYYIDSKRVLFHPEAVALLGELLVEATADISFEAIGGLEVGAIPMAAAALAGYHKAGRHVEGFFVRKEAKDHGSKARVEGQVKTGDRVVVIDDVLTTGGSCLQAIQEVEKLGAKVVRAICICDRLAGAREALAKYDFRSLFTIEDFGLKPLPVPKRFAVFHTYGPDKGKIAVARPAHRAYLTSLMDRGELVTAGPFTDDSGALIVYEAIDEAGVLKLIQNDPFHAAGVFQTWQIKPWKTVFVHGPYLPAMTP